MGAVSRTASSTWCTTWPTLSTRSPSASQFGHQLKQALLSPTENALCCFLALSAESCHLAGELSSVRKLHVCRSPERPLTFACNLVRHFDARLFPIEKCG